MYPVIFKAGPYIIQELRERVERSRIAEARDRAKGVPDEGILYALTLCDQKLYPS
jgi:hypothetical protein